MVFSNLSSSEKDAFFGLLDEYFASRPDVFGSATGSDSGAASNNTLNNQVNAAAGKAALSAIRSSFAGHPDAANGTSGPTLPAWKRQRELSSNSSQPTNSEPEASSGMGRVAAAAAALRLNPSGSSSNAPPPRPPPRGVSSDESTAAPSPPPAPGRASTSTNKLLNQKKFGDVDLSSAKNMYQSIRHGTANKTATPPPVAPPVPAAFTTPRKQFAPPPVRRVSSATPEPVKAAPPPPPPRAEPEPEAVEQGEWAEALYDYSSEDPGDLQLQEGQHVYVVERTSDDWWTAVVDDRRGLIPASYVKML
ncbi:hypothetical protein BC835DRAFT_505457 [Cytidiella melzeri]|nr:hypothetical protein BC835DRAFT_505457 [Cytidiella melzeri]